jgi:hypothetical protein
MKRNVGPERVVEQLADPLQHLRPDPPAR